MSEELLDTRLKELSAGICLTDGLRAKLVPLTKICLYWPVMSSAIFLLAIKTHILLLDIREMNQHLCDFVVGGLVDWFAVGLGYVITIDGSHFSENFTEVEGFSPRNM